MRARDLFFRWNTPLDRRTYATTGLTLAALKYAVDALLIWSATGRTWTPFNYLNSTPFALDWHSMTWRAVSPSEWLLPVLLIWTLPFVWLGVTMTARRAIDAGVSEWICLLFFVPVGNYATMLLLCVLPTRARDGATVLALNQAANEDLSERRLPTVFLAATAGMTLGLVMVWISVALLRTYGGALFIGTPFVIGAVVGFLENRRAPQTASATNAAIILTLLLTAFALFAVAGEGVVCIVMAIPVAIPLGLLGGLIGRGIAGGPRAGARPAALSVLVLPLWLALEPPASTGQIQHDVLSSIEINAPAATVWPHVIAFQPIPAPDDLIFRAGVAYPVRAHIEGDGVGAVRYCEFSTGAFVEPITRWAPGETLAFDVTASPPPMTEWSPYRNVHPPHLDGYLRARRGEFRLVPLGDGRTRLEGRTWYELEMGPEGYWQLWSDHMIHRIHMRVLEQIKRESEGSAIHGNEIRRD